MVDRGGQVRSNLRSSRPNPPGRRRFAGCGWTKIPSLCIFSLGASSDFNLSTVAGGEALTTSASRQAINVSNLFKTPRTTRSGEIDFFVDSCFRA